MRWIWPHLQKSLTHLHLALWGRAAGSPPNPGLTPGEIPPSPPRDAAGGRPSCRCQNFDPVALCSNERCEKKMSPSTDHGPLHLGSHLMGMGSGPQQDWRMGTCQAVLQRLCPSTRCGAQLLFHIGQPRINISAVWDTRWGWGALHSTRAAPRQPPTAGGGP